MSKDPAFLFYPGDWLGGTIGMTFEEKGAYMELLMMQFNRGHMTSHMIGQVVGQLWVKLEDKFKQDAEGLWYNERLDFEKESRKSFVESRKNNIKGENQYTKKTGHMTKHMTSHTSGHMEDENENENKDINKSINKEEVISLKPLWAENFKEYHTGIIYPFEMPEFCQAWDLWIAYRRERRFASYKVIGEQSALNQLSDHSQGNVQTALSIIKQSISNGWQGLFALKKTTNGKNTYNHRESSETINSIIDQAFKGS